MSRLRSALPWLLALAVLATGVGWFLASSLYWAGCPSRTVT